MKKVTKREKKKLKGPNAMVRRSLRDGKEFRVGDVAYRGVFYIPWVRA